jgi:hypothetical protein
MQVIVQVSEDVARALNQQEPHNADSQAILKTIEVFGLTLESMHGDTDDSSLQSYFTVKVQDHGTAQRITERLLKLEAIKAAYVKPSDELP